MNEYQRKRKEFLQANGFENTPVVRFIYSQLKADELSDEDILKKMIRRGAKNGTNIRTAN